MPTNGSLNRKLRMALVGGGQGAFIGRVHATAAVLDNRAALVAGLCPAIRPRPRPRPPTTTFPPTGPTARIKELVAEGKGPAGRQADRFRLRRHAEPHALRDRQGRRRGRLQRHLRQADDVRPGPGRGAGRGRREVRRRLRRDAQLHRLSARAAGPRDDPDRRAGRDQRRSAPTTSRAGSARGWRASDQKQAAWRTDPTQERRGRLLRRHRHARLQPRPLHDRPAARRRSAAT